MDFSRFHSFIDGVWVSRAYIESLKKSCSPYDSKNYLENIASLAIGTDKAISKGDSAVIGMSLNNHEGGDMTLYFRPGQKTNNIKTNYPDYNNRWNYYELGYNLDSGDTSVVIYHYNKEKKLIDSVRYSRVMKTLITDMGKRIQFITNKILIAGTYLMKDDSTKSIQQVAFTNDSKVEGFNAFKAFYLCTDFEPEPKFDTIEFLEEENEFKNANTYAYKIKGDTIKLYNILANKDSTKYKIGSLKYLLVKRKG